MRQFMVVAHFELKSIRLGQYPARKPLEAIIAAKEHNGQWAAQQLGCKFEELSWEAEEDFL
jgi:hypothetical protein